MESAISQLLGCVPGTRSENREVQSQMQTLNRTEPSHGQTPRFGPIHGFPFTSPNSFFKVPDSILNPFVSSDTHQVDELETRIAELERKAKSVAENTNAPSDLDVLLNYEQPVHVNIKPEGEEPGENVGATPPPIEPSSSKFSCPNPCARLWGGPTMPSSDQNMWGFAENFFGGVTTAHGINQAFKDNNGILRRIIWVLFFALSFWGLFWAVISAVEQFIAAYGASQVSTLDHGALLPMVTMCNLSPIRCGCSAFYHPTILADDKLVARVLPYVCSSVLVLKNTSWEPLGPGAAPLSYDLLENAARYVELELTKARMAALPASSKLTCDAPGYTEATVVSRIADGTLTLQELYAYGGYAVRSRLVRGCMTTDTRPGSPTLGHKVSCIGDAWWGPPLFHAAYGACQTFNPCHGFPVGHACLADADCAHDTIKSRPGGM